MIFALVGTASQALENILLHLHCGWFDQWDNQHIQHLQWLHPSPVALPNEWPAYVNSAMHEKELDQLRHSVVHGTPFGDAPWTEKTADRLGLEETLHPPGRPQKESPAGRVSPATSLFG